MKKTVKILLSLLCAIVIGAIGSGLWERVLSHWYDGLINASVNMMSFLVSTYRDSIYKDVSDGFHEYSAVFVHAMVLMILPVLYFIIWLRHPESKPTIGHPVREFIRSRRGYYTIGIVTLSLFATFAISSFKIMYTNRIVTHSLKTIDIVAPYVSEQENRQLLATFRSITTKQDYDDFAERVSSIAQTNSVVLPELK
jgi:hypothetical protein